MQLATRALLVWLCLGGLAPAGLTGQTVPAQPPTYEVYAVRYGMLPGFPTRALIAGADSSRRSDVAMTVWLLKGPEGRTVLVDAGFYRDEFIRAWKPTDFQRPSDALDSMGVSPASVTDIIISHIHWDHLDGADLFPNARVWIQRAEYEYYVGPRGEALQQAISPVDAAMLARLRAAGRVHLVDGDAQEIIPGIRVFTGGRHTYASQYAAVNTRSGTAVIASDNVYLYENLDRHVPIGSTLDPKANLAAQDRMAQLAASKDLIIPGHDPAVFERFPATRKGVVRIAPAADPATIARSVFVAMDAGDFARTGALLDDSFRLHYQGVPDPISKASLLEMLRAYAVAFPDMRHDVEEVLPSGSHVTVRLVLYATHKGDYEGVAATGKPVTVAGIHILRIANGRIAEWWAAEDDLGLLRQIGMVIKPPPSSP